jgi:hypothetical protein
MQRTMVTGSDSHPRGHEIPPDSRGLVPAILTRTEFAKDAIPVSKHPMEMTVSYRTTTGSAARAVRQYQRRLVVRRETGKE